MAIKFGDLIENVNADRAVIDLIANNAKGLLFVTDFDNATASAANTGIAGIAEELRSPGSIVLDKTDGVLYAWKGITNGTITEQVVAGDAVTPGAWDDVAAATTDWVQIGKVDRRESVLTANISSGPDTIDGAFAGTGGTTLLSHVNTLREKLNELITNPPRTFGKFTAGQDAVGSGDLPAGMTALQIIERALSQMQGYDVVITSSSTIENQQQTGTNTISLTVNSPNFNLTNASAANIEPIKYRLWYRQIGDTIFLASGSDVSFAADDFTSSSSTATKTIDHAFTVTGAISAFSGFEYKVEIRDNSDEADLAGVSGGAIAGEPVRGVSNLLQIVENPYVNATGALSLTAANNESSSAALGQPDNYSTFLRSKGNHATNVSWSITASDSNAGPGAVVSITDYAVQVRTRTNGVFGGWGNVTTSSVTDHNPTGSGNFSSRAGTFALNVSGLDLNQVDGLQFRVRYTDAVVTDQVVSTSSEVKFRYAILAGFLDVGAGQVINTFGDFTALTQANLKSMRLTPGGWSANDSEVQQGYSSGASYGSTLNSGESFPRLDSNYGYAQSGDNATPNYSSGTSLFAGTSTGSSPGAFGWAHNSQSTPAPSDFPDALQGGSGTRFIVAVPDGGAGTSNLGFGLIESLNINTNGSIFGEVNITNDFGAIKAYVVSVQSGINSMNSALGTKAAFLIKPL